MYRLSRAAARDLLQLLSESRRRWGPAVAERTRGRIRQRLEDIASGVLMGHRREEIGADLPYLFVNEAPFVIVYDRRTRLIVRIVHGRRNLLPLLEAADGESR